MKLKELIEETIYKFIKENRFEKRDTEQYKNCLISDLARMELVDLFFKKIEKNPSYNTAEPDYFKLIDDWSGYDDQVYIQNKISENIFIFWEGWVSECWNAIKLKPEYDKLKQSDVIEKIIKNRFPRIGEEFGFKIDNYEYFKYKGKYIMKIIFKKETN